MKVAKYLAWTVAISVIGWSISIDIMTYNVLFPTDRPIVLYCLDGLVFNWVKIAIPFGVAATIEILERLINESRVNNRFVFSQVKRFEDYTG